MTVAKWTLMSYIEAVGIGPRSVRNGPGCHNIAIEPGGTCQTPLETGHGK